MNRERSASDKGLSGEQAEGGNTPSHRREISVQGYDTATGRRVDVVMSVPASNVRFLNGPFPTVAEEAAHASLRVQGPGFSSDHSNHDPENPDPQCAQCHGIS